MSSRSYLSIGDVLTLLRQEFPDVTISKIRFLESQGLVNPERTPSGYRKFYEHDVERLRWVLRQQREHFLPLKVIKDRLDDDPGESGNAVSSHGGTTASERPSTAASVEGPMEESTEEHRAAEPVLVGHRVSTEHRGASAEARGAGDSGSTVIGDGPTLPGIESAGSRAIDAAGSKSGSAGGSASGSSAATLASASTAGASSSHRAVGSDHSSDRSHALGMVDAGGAMGRAASTADSASPSGAAVSGSAARRSKATSAPNDPTPKTGGTKPRSSAVGESPSSGAEPAAANGAKEAGDPPTKSRPISEPVDLVGANLSVDELSAACGLDVGVLRELQEYGLLTSDSIAGVEYFDEEALAVANLAAQFARFGIEPRHLRLYKNAAEREAGFVEQIVLPLVRQRNPDARARAHETADELTRLGQQLRGSLLRSALGNLLNG